MRTRKIALTGPAAAKVHGLDGFRDDVWPLLWCVPNGSDAGERLVEVRRWEQPILTDAGLVAPIATVLRHLDVIPVDLLGREDRISPADRIELALEHALRLGIEPTLARGGRHLGENKLREILHRRGAEPPTESYAETRAAQLFRTLGREPWRQIVIPVAEGESLRADFMIPFRDGPRPDVVRPEHGLLIEVDSREFHEQQFERDHAKQTTYALLGYHFMTVTPYQVEYRADRLLRAVNGVLDRDRPKRTPGAKPSSKRQLLVAAEAA
jgi:hypothetical protein